MNSTDKACPFTIQNLIKIEISKNDGASRYFHWCMTLTIGPLTDFSLLFPVVCFVFVFDQTLVEHLYRGKSLLFALGMLLFQVGWNTFTNRATPWEKASFFLSSLRLSNSLRS